MSPTVLILGGRGRFGLACAHAFCAAGARVLAQVRPGSPVPELPGVTWLAHDVLDSAGLARLAAGATVVVHALNPAYTNRAWSTQALPLLDAALALTRTLGATLMLPGNVYNFGASMPAVLREDTPQLAHTVKGRIRVEMEQRMAQSGVRSVVIRAGDFFGSGRGTSFDLMLVKDLAKGVLGAGGLPDVATPWAYVPDLAQTFVQVAQRRSQLQRFEVLHFAGHQISPRQWQALLTPVARSQGWIGSQAPLQLRRLPWGLLRVVGWAVPLVASLVEMRYLGETPHALANDKLRALLGKEPHTPLDEAVSAALQGLGMLAAPACLTTAAA